MGMISMEQTDRLYWLGRYSERVYTTLQLFEKSFDIMIDVEENAYDEFCQRLEIPNIYHSGDDFVERYCFDDTNTDSIYSNLMRAYDNGIVLREEIGSETLAYIQLAVYEMQKARGNRAPVIAFQKVMDNIMAFWGMVDDSIQDENIRNLIKTGKRIERMDLFARLHQKKDDLEREVYRMKLVIDRTKLNYNKEMITEMEERLQDAEIDYRKIVILVESIV